MNHCSVFSLENSLRRVHWISLVHVEDFKALVLICGCALSRSVMLLTLAVVLPTPHDYIDTFQGGYSGKFIVSRS